MYEFVKANAKDHPTELLCRVLGVSRSAYYSWHNGHKPHQHEKQKTMEQKIIDCFWDHRRRYGARRISQALTQAGEPVSRYKAAKVLRLHGLKAIQPRSFVPKTTDSRHSYKISPNLLLDRAMPVRPNEVWVGDITYIPLSGGSWAYLGEWMDLYSRKIIGWHLDNHMREELVTTAFKKALQGRKDFQGAIIHSDRGGQYAGGEFRKMIADHHLLQSMSRAENPYDNSFMESCFSRFKAELLEGGAFENLEDAQTEIFEFIEMYYNTIRLHSSLNYQSPNTYEKNFRDSRIFEMHKQEAMLYTEESPLIERDIESLSIKHKQDGSALPKESVLIH